MVTLKVSEAFVDPAIPEGAHSISDGAKDPGAGSGGAGGDGFNDAGAAKTIYYALCQDDPGDGVTGGWLGPNRTTREDAQADAEAHKKENAGHNPIVLSS